MPPKKNTKLEGLRSEHPRAVVRFRPADWSANLVASGLSAEPMTLHYFAIRGLGELPRLMLELCQIPYDSVMYWTTTEFKEIAPFGQMPLLMGSELDDEDQILCQSATIVRYLAKEASLDGSEQGAVGEARADMIFECSKDITSNKGAIHTNETEKLHGMLTKATELLDEFEGPYFSGMSVTYGDVGMFHVLSTIEEVKPGYLKKNGFEDLAAFVKLFSELPPIANYLSSDRRMPLTANEVGDKPWSPDGYKYLKPVNAEAYSEEYVEPVFQLDDDDDDDDDDEMIEDGEEEEEEEEADGAKPPAKKAKK
eukprot:CAMPEP_0206041972 /NCGR_PEP_ID=MMETSP1466-20131121/6274_1 /ASSEMBLY_ACC=CAM_ASM_001126 /TAXON_ID=44452 /ORGANISM="Pavlova gyrans, Strain CCMP608" /LENGTH=309 /DNA_ID=CAMNT_0053416677 /DNA_START=27 /DNA_END=956 /DNA_ORIENTATION=-